MSRSDNGERHPSTGIRLALGLATLLAVLGGGCVQGPYLLQAIYGQDELSYRARPLAEVVADEAVPRQTRRMLALIEHIKAFGAHRGLEITDNYADYVELGRPAVVWNVSAAQPLRFEAVTWTFPIVGSVPYLGWFNERDAVAFAARLRDEGYDVDLRPVRAYSTLGWFADPVLSSMIRPRPSAVGDLVNVVLHESVHATHYVANQSFFNESLANFVANELTMEYLEDQLRLDRWQLLAYRQARARRDERARRFHETYVKLDELYRSPLSDADKLAQKQQITEALRQELDFGRPINNAVLSQSRTYNAGSPILAKLLRCVDHDWGRFWAAVKRIDAAAFTQPQQPDIEPLVLPHMTGCGEGGRLPVPAATDR
jgi:predicted aminopeptidase